MKHKRKQFSNYVRWDFEIQHGGYKVFIVVKDHHRKFSDCIFAAYWSTPKMRASQWHVHPTTYRGWDKGHRTLARQELFQRLRISMNYGLNVKGRVVIDRLMGANGQRIPHIKKQISGKG